MSYADKIFNEQKALIDIISTEKRKIKNRYPKEKTIGEMLKGTSEERRKAIDILIKIKKEL